VNERTCIEDDCDQDAWCRWLCRTHYHRRWRNKIEMPPNMPASNSLTPQPLWHRLTEVDKEAGVGVCSICGPVRVRVRGGGKGSTCYTLIRRQRERQRRRRGSRPRTSPSDSRDAKLRKQYNITETDYDALLASQGGGCFICGALPTPKRRLAVDHDHACCPGKTSCGMCVRGLLCTKCNLLLGRIADDEHRIRSMARYFDRSA